MCEWFSGENGDFELLFLTAKGTRKLRFLIFLAKTQSRKVLRDATLFMEHGLRGLNGFSRILIASL